MMPFVGFVLWSEEPGRLVESSDSGNVGDKRHLRLDQCDQHHPCCRDRPVQYLHMELNSDQGICFWK
jgi:hypothetical protein